MKAGHPQIVLMNRTQDETITLDEYRGSGGYRGLERAIREYTPVQVKQVVLDAGLRGHGGAGFPTGRKWSFLREDAPFPRYVIANTDEMEPGTFKDRALVSINPHAVIEGMAIASYAVSAQEGIFFVRPSYDTAALIFERALEEAREAGYLGQRILGSNHSFDITAHRSAGRYICGETKGLIHALEGERPHPNIESHLTERGFWGKPTVINNAETLAYVPAILHRGPEWFRDLGRHKGAAGNKIYSVSGRVNRPGIFELPLGTPLEELIYEHAGGMREGLRFKACLPGGASTRYITKEHLGVEMDFDSPGRLGPGHRMGTGAVVVFDDRTCLVGATLNLMEFFARESCGWCTPCREGIPYIRDLLRLIEEGEGRPEYVDMIRRMCDYLPHSYCAFAVGAAAPLLGLMEDFRSEVEEHIRGGGCPLSRK